MGKKNYPDARDIFREGVRKKLVSPQKTVFQMKKLGLFRAFRLYRADAKVVAEVLNIQTISPDGSYTLKVSTRSKFDDLMTANDFITSQR